MYAPCFHFRCWPHTHTHTHSMLATRACDRSESPRGVPGSTLYNGTCGDCRSVRRSSTWSSPISPSAFAPAPPKYTAPLAISDALRALTDLMIFYFIFYFLIFLLLFHLVRTKQSNHVLYPLALKELARVTKLQGYANRCLLRVVSLVVSCCRVVLSCRVVSRVLTGGGM
jgi:hypothetical protein